MKRPERPWATGVLVVSGMVSLSFNVQHSLHMHGARHLPGPLAFLYGAAPIALAAAQSHVVAIQAARGEMVDGWRKVFTFGLVIGALALSFLGIYDLLNHAVPNPFPHAPFNAPAILTPIVIDLMAIAALHELLRVPNAFQSIVATATTSVMPDAVVAETTSPLPVERAPLTTTLTGGLSLTGTTARTTADDHLETTIERPQATTPDDRPIWHQTTTSDDRSSGTSDPGKTTPRKTAATRKTRRPTDAENADAVAVYRASVKDGQLLSERALADRFGRSKGWARDRIQEAGPQPVGGRSLPVDHGPAETPKDHPQTTSEENVG